MVLTCFVYLWFALQWDPAFQLVSCFTGISLIYFWRFLELDACFGSLVDIVKISLQCWNVGQYCIALIETETEQRLSKIIVIPTLMSQTPGKLYISKTKLSTESSSSEIGGLEIELNNSFHRVNRVESWEWCQNIWSKLAVLCNVFLYLCWRPEAECLSRSRL